MSTLSSVTDGQLCDDAGVPGCAPKVVVQQSGTQAVAPSNPTTVSVQSFAATVVSLRQSAQVVVGGTQAPQVVVNDQSQRIVTTGQQGPRGDAGAVTTVNGMVGDVVLNAPDVNADPEGAAIAAAGSAMAMHLADPDPHGQYVADGDVLNGGNF